ncbi:MAG: twin-arginine translocase TatA/TatE family subunit [Chloroflexota bacterium]|nr:twin-arginine translocase TatA/TatE family subunit [Chloroflexota bacterium]
MGAISPAHLILILVIALLVLGPGKLPETGAALGRAVRGFRDAVEGKDPPAAEASEAGDPLDGDPK